jgi:hypothetical protein
MLEQPLYPQTIYELVKTFNINNWVIETQDEDSLFNKFCNMLTTFNKEQQSLILELTKNFIKISGGDYNEYLHILFQNFIKEYPLYKKLYIIPILSKNDITSHHTAKSSIFLAYVIKSNKASFEKKYDIKINIIDSIDAQGSFKNAIPLNIKEISNSAICCIDDFIGSGETVISAIEYLKENIELGDNLFILSLVAQKIGLDELSANGLKVITALERKRGITDISNSDNLETNIGLMKTMEAILKVKTDFSFGYKQSEALVSLERTPNNTFPVFWLEKKINK